MNDDDRINHRNDGSGGRKGVKEKSSATTGTGGGSAPEFGLL